MSNSETPGNGGETLAESIDGATSPAYGRSHVDRHLSRRRRPAAVHHDVVGPADPLGEWRHIVPDRHSAREAKDVVLHDIKVKKQAPPQGKYNAAQRISYTVIRSGWGNFRSMVTGYQIERRGPMS